MPTISRRTLASAIATRLESVTHATGYYGQVGRTLTGSMDVDPPTKGPQDPRVAPYFVLYPGAGHNAPQEPLAHDGIQDQMTLPVRITAVAGDVVDLLALVDRVDARLLRWAPTVAGVVCGPLARPFGWVSPNTLLDTNVTPPRLFLPLEYQTIATT